MSIIDWYAANIDHMKSISWKKGYLCAKLKNLDALLGLSITTNWNYVSVVINTLRPEQNADYIFECVLNEKLYILIKIPLKFVLRGTTDTKSALVRVMAWRWIGDRPLPETIIIQFADAYMHTRDPASICQTAEIIAHWHVKINGCIFNFGVSNNVTIDIMQQVASGYS